MRGLEPVRISEFGRIKARSVTSLVKTLLARSDFAEGGSETVIWIHFHACIRNDQLRQHLTCFSMLRRRIEEGEKPISYWEDSKRIADIDIYPFSLDCANDPSMSFEIQYIIHEQFADNLFLISNCCQTLPESPILLCAGLFQWYTYSYVSSILRLNLLSILMQVHGSMPLAAAKSTLTAFVIYDSDTGESLSTPRPLRSCALPPESISKGREQYSERARICNAARSG